MSSINCNGKLIDLSAPKVMGILNITPDSFYDGGRYHSKSTIIEQTAKMLNEGATFIDVGAASSRPGAPEIPLDTERALLLPIIELLVKEFPEILISVDTFRSEIARDAISKGACMINDISAGSLDSRMYKTVAQLQVPYILMHMRGTPKNMQQEPTYEDVVRELTLFFSERIYELNNLGVNDVILDVGFGFGKTVAHNYELLQKLAMFSILDKPILVGLSRKSMLFKPLQTNPENALNATTSANTIALLNGANIIRVHDVHEAVEAIKIVELLKKNDK